MAKTKEKRVDKMKDNKNQVIKVCSFYVNNWHLTTMLLPHINKKVEENTKVLTILEQGIKNNIEELLSKMNLDPITQNKILEINFASKPICKYSEIKKQIEENEKDIRRNKHHSKWNSRIHRNSKQKYTGK